MGLKIYKDDEDDLNKNTKIIKSTPATNYIKGNGDEKIINFAKCESKKELSLPIQLSVFSYKPNKIFFILDLDFTLVQTFLITNPVDKYNLSKDKRIHFFTYYDAEMGAIFRPEIPQFLSSVSQFAELFVYTHGERKYANILVNNFIDPDKKFISREKFYASDKHVDATKAKSLIKFYFDIFNDL